MALVVKDRVQETTTTVGTGTVTLGGAVLSFQTFAAIGDGNTTYYAIVDPTAGDWEAGIGTYTASGTTLSRTTVLSSSNGGSPVSFGAGTKNVICTYPSERAIYLDSAGSYPVQNTFNTLTASSIALTTGTITTAPTGNTDIVNKQYADAIASGIHFHEAVALATTTTLPANTYNNGTSGVGATLTANANGALSVDSTLTVVAERILVKNEAAGENNGVYVVTQVGSAGTPYILTRATDFDTVGTGVDQIDEGDFFLVTSGVVNLNTAWVQQTAPPITIGTTAIVFQQFSAPITYTAGTGLNESPSFTFNIANTAVTPASYGLAGSVPTITVNAQGQITSAIDTAIAISSAAVSGLAASATTDTTDASNITTGTLGTSRLSGSYTGITGVGTLTAGTWNATAIGPVYGGTGFTSYAVGDIVYADTTTSLAKLPDVAVGNALISGGVAAAPSWGKIGLATHVSGTLPIANGGTGSTSTQFVALGTNVSGTLPIANGGTGVDSTTTTDKFFFAAPNASSGAPTFRAIVASDVPTLNQSTTGSAATLTTPRAIYGNNFNGSAALTQVIASTYGGTGNGFTKFSGPATAEKTFTLPDANATILTTNAAVTVAQGGTGATTLTTNNVLLGNGTSAPQFVAPGTTGNVLTSNGTTWTSAAAGGGFAAGTAILFYQAAAPTGWTQVTTQNNKALRVVSGAGGGTGGSVAFTTAFASQTPTGSVAVSLNNTTATGSVPLSVGGSVGSTTLALSQTPSHDHSVSRAFCGCGTVAAAAGYLYYSDVSTPNANARVFANGGGGSHNHGFTNPSYSFSGTAHTHTIASQTFTGSAINLAVQYIDVIICTKN
jgi:hypothetical protein